MSLYPPEHLRICAQQKDPPPFIATQTIYRLKIGPKGLAAGEKRKCVELGPRGERASRQREMELSRITKTEFPEGAAWKRNRGPELRQKFLASQKLKHLCLLVNAGSGKTTAIRQAQYLRNQHRGHMALGVEFARLPTKCDDFWPFLTDLFRHSDSELANIDPHTARSFLKRLVAAERFSF